MRAALGLLAVLAPGIVLAHQLTHAVQTGSALIVEFRYADGSPFSYEAAEVFRPGESIPFLAGRTDANGRVAFVPDRAGDWRVRAFSEDGHGGDFAVPAGPGGVGAADADGLGVLGRDAVGLSLLFGAFGLWSLFARRRK